MRGTSAHVKGALLYSLLLSVDGTLFSEAGDLLTQRSVYPIALLRSCQKQPCKIRKKCLQETNHTFKSLWFILACSQPVACTGLRGGRGRNGVRRAQSWWWGGGGVMWCCSPSAIHDFSTVLFHVVFSILQGVRAIQPIWANQFPKHKDKAFQGNKI